MPRRVGHNLFQLIILHLLLQACEALTLFPPPPPVFLGTTVRVTWTSTPGDPASFDLFAQCNGTPSTPHLNVTTAEGQVFVVLPSGFHFNFALPCVLQGRMHLTNQLLSSAPFSLILGDASGAAGPTVGVPGSSAPMSTTQKASDTTQGVTIPGIIQSVTSVPSVDAIKTISEGFVVSMTSSIQSSATSSRLFSGLTSIPTSTSTSSSRLTATSSLALPSATQSQGQTGVHPPNQTPKKLPVGIIVGGSVGATLVLLVLLLACYFYTGYRRQRRSMLIPVAYGEMDSPSVNRTGTTREKAAITGGSQLHHPRNPALGTRSNRSLSTTSEEIATDQPLRQMVLTMRERIVVLEAQRREAVVQEGGWAYDDGLPQQPPPEYSSDVRNSNHRPLPPAPVSMTPLQQSELATAGPKPVYTIEDVG